MHYTAVLKRLNWARGVQGVGLEIVVLSVTAAKSCSTPGPEKVRSQVLLLKKSLSCLIRLFKLNVFSTLACH